MNKIFSKFVGNCQVNGKIRCETTALLSAVCCLTSSRPINLRTDHSTRSRLQPRMLSEIMQTVENGDASGLVTAVLTQSTEPFYCIALKCRTASATQHSIQWFQSYLTNRYQCVRRGEMRSSMTQLSCNVTQGSALDPISCSISTPPI
jgi:hypothetical protein